MRVQPTCQKPGFSSRRAHVSAERAKPDRANVASAAFFAVMSLAALSTTAASAAITHLAAPDKDAVLNRKFDIVTITSNIPKCVRDEFANVTGAKQFSMADPGEQFQSSDYNTSPNLPYYRLIFAGQTDSYYIIEALRGGHAPASVVFLFKIEAPKTKDAPFVIHQVHGPVPHTDGAIVFDHSPQSAKLIWSASEDQAGGDLDGVRKAITLNKMDDSNVDIAVPAAVDANSPGNIGGSMPTLTKAW